LQEKAKISTRTEFLSRRLVKLANAGFAVESAHLIDRATCCSRNFVLYYQARAVKNAGRLNLMKSHAPVRLLMVASAALVLLSTSFAQSSKKVLAVGDKAPPLKVDSFVKGTAISEFPKDRYSVVEFWATWCGPCKQTIPHLTEMAKRYGEKVVFTGVSVWERPNGADKNNLAGVKTFVGEMGDKMNYNVAVDTAEGEMAKTWMMAAEQDGIPTAFVVDPTGTIIWIGHPMEMEEPLKEMVAGTYDVKAQAEKARKERAEKNEMAALMAPLQAAAASGDMEKMVAELDKIFAKKPEMENRLGMAKFTTLARIDEARAMAYAKKLGNGPLKESPMQLNELAWSIIEPDATFTKPDIQLARDLAARAVGLLKTPDMQRAMVLDTLAYAEYLLGNKKAALKVQQEALDILAKLPASEVDADTRKELEERLAKYKG
jgi:thiol-disulfide isomerase/thioredoxin